MKSKESAKLPAQERELKEYREFWITEGSYEGDGPNFPKDPFYSTVLKEPYSEGIHVIEYAAYEALQSKLQETTQELNEANAKLQATKELVDRVKNEATLLKKQLDKILDYCEPHLNKMWAANTASTILGCDFRDCKEALKSKRIQDEINKLEQGDTKSPKET